MADFVIKLLPKSHDLGLTSVSEGGNVLPVAERTTSRHITAGGWKVTRKDFELIARVLKNSDEVLDDMAREALAEMFAAELSDTNPAFDRRRFLAAAAALPIKVGSPVGGEW